MRKQKRWNNVFGRQNSKENEMKNVCKKLVPRVSLFFCTLALLFLSFLSFFLYFFLSLFLSWNYLPHFLYFETSQCISFIFVTYCTIFIHLLHFFVCLSFLVCMCVFLSLFIFLNFEYLSLSLSYSKTCNYSDSQAPKAPAFQQFFFWNFSFFDSQVL